MKATKIWKNLQTFFAVWRLSNFSGILRMHKLYNFGCQYCLEDILLSPYLFFYFLRDSQSPGNLGTQSNSCKPPITFYKSRGDLWKLSIDSALCCHAGKGNSYLSWVVFRSKTMYNGDRTILKLHMNWLAQTSIEKSFSSKSNVLITDNLFYSKKKFEKSYLLHKNIQYY